MRVLVCDDEQLARERLVRLIDSLDDVEVVEQASNGREAVLAAQRVQPDVVLMDIRMPDMDGLEAAAHMARAEEPPAVIFCTAYDEHALDAFRVHAMDYLLKPVNREELSAALARADGLARHQRIPDNLEGAASGRRRRHISARTHRGMELVPVADVRYFLADQKYITVRYGDGEVLIDETLKDLEEEFGDQFVRVHRNALAALSYIEGMEQSGHGHHQLRLRGLDEPLVVSRRHVAGLRKLMQRL
ncbi:LytTR family DNA-binding domain-containing protein [Alcanivorax sp. JB21]|uniref:LytR/AlgR family response regulator transcription factor n=1 Tax=Alcanivorax limicola TaxID=2874102 RepID=UPI001CC0B667|nr:LytTR family DNA-binding domain-containing protein [Alcanivorax limicola]MBZ2189202.1 LytTR family DNA-binding domain-containing protein [Alcanivorax limicola]